MQSATDCLPRGTWLRATGALALLMLLSLSAVAGPGSFGSFASGPRQALLVELYTSEGCSSCPPADQWLAKLATDESLWREVVPVAFHVDYWDYLGWPDRFANARFSDRQRRYARLGATRTVYTPGVMAGGREWRGWWQNEPLPTGSARAGVLTLHENDGAISLTYETERSLKSLNGHVALLGFGLRTAVRRGENAGRELAHEFVVLDWQQTTLSRNDGVFTASLRRPGTEVDAERFALAAWVSQGQGPPLQAVGGWMEADDW